MRLFGWEPIIYTPSNPERPEIDHSLEKDIPNDIQILKQPIWEPYSFYKKFVGLKKDEKLGAGLMQTGQESSFFKELSVWIRGNFFIPDARKFWIRPSIKFLNHYLSDHSIDAIVSTGPPHSMHLIAKKIAERFSIPWLADFRDPWTNIDFFEDLKLTPIARRKHHQLEKSVLDACDELAVVSPTMKEEFEDMTDTPICMIPNGYDAEDFGDEKYTPNERFILSHIGMMSASRNPKVLWEALSELSDEYSEFSKKFTLRLIGKVDGAVHNDIQAFGLEHLVEVEDYVPHDEVVNLQQQSEALLLIINNTPNAAMILTGKLFEYIAAKRPIICLSPVKGDVKSVLEESQAGTFILYSQKDRLKEELYSQFKNWQNGVSSYQSTGSKKYSRQYLTEQICTELDKLTS